MFDQVQHVVVVCIKAMSSASGLILEGEGFSTDSVLVLWISY